MVSSVTFFPILGNQESRKGLREGRWVHGVGISEKRWRVLGMAEEIVQFPSMPGHTLPVSF